MTGMCRSLIVLRTVQEVCPMRLLNYVLLPVFIAGSLQAGTFTEADSLSGDGTPLAAATSSVVRSAPTINPDISAIGDFRAYASSEGPRNIETYFHALEVQLSSVVDPYASAKFIFSFGKDSLGGDYGAGLEIATITSLSLPYSLQATLGRFKPHVAKVNTLHPHAFSFIEFPAMIRNYFGDEGLFMEGISASVLVPNPWDVYQEFTLEAGRPSSSPLLEYGTDNRLMYAAHLDNFFELSDNSTLGVGLSGFTGMNAFDRSSVVGGFDLTYKWKPVQFNTYRSFTWQTEGMIVRTDTAAGNGIESFGAYTLFEYQLSRRTFIGTRLDYSAQPYSPESDERSAALLLRFQPSEYQILALEVQNVNRHDAPDFYRVQFRVIFGIGKHAAHAY